MTKGRKVILAIAGVFTLGFISIYVADSFLDLGLFSHNSIEVSADQPLDIDKVNIQQGYWTINRINDSILFEDSSENSTVYGTWFSSKINSDYGENDFLVTYDDKYYYQFRHFIFNSRHYHDYRFHFTKINEDIKLKVNIVGADGMKFERKMNLISKSEEMKTNVRKEEAGNIYNMKELEKK